MTTRTEIKNARFNGELYTCTLKYVTRGDGVRHMTWLDTARDSSGRLVTDEQIRNTLRHILGVS